MSIQKLTTKLRLKRNASDTFQSISAAQSTDETKKLSYGEPLYIAAEDYIVIGGTDETQTLETNGKVLRLLKKDVADGIGTKWLDNFIFNINSSEYTRYKIKDDGTLSEETTTEAPCGVKITKTTSGTGNNLANIKSTMSPELSLSIPANQRNNPQYCKSALKLFATITTAESGNGEIILFFTRKLPNSEFNLNLIGG